MSTRLSLAIVLAALAAAGGVVAIVLASDHADPKVAWAVFGPAVGLLFVLTGLYAWRQRPESRTGWLMVLLGFAWMLSLLQYSNSSLVHTFALSTIGLWGGVFLHLGISFPSGRVAPGLDRAIVIAGYLLFTFALIPVLFFADSDLVGCDGCPDNLLLIERNDDVANAALALSVLAYVVLFVVVLVRSIRHWRDASRFERLQLTPVYVCALLTFLLVTIARAGAGNAAWWPAFIATALLPFAFLGGLLRSHVSHLDAELRESLDELRASRARIVEAGDAERRRIERDLHDGAQSRLVGLALLLRAARKRAQGDSELAELLERAQEELDTSLAELRELARGIHPAVLTDRGLEPALQALASRAPVPVTVETCGGRLPGPVESAAYFVVSEALVNIAKYARASEAAVAVRRVDGRVIVDVTDDGVGGADATVGSGLRGLADRVAALDGTLAVDSPAGRGTRVHAEIPVS